jgi:hypothetical protein
VFERLDCMRERFGMRNRVERFFKYLKEGLYKMSIRNHIQGITNTLIWTLSKNEVKNAYMRVQGLIIYES